MNTRPVGVGAAGLLVCLLLGGCASATPSGSGSPTTPGSSTEDAAPSAGRTGPTGTTGPNGARGRGGDDDAGERRERGPDGERGAGPDEGEPAPSGEDTTGSGSNGSGSGSDTGLEVPEAPQPGVTSLAELMGPATASPLVTAPLPRTAAARGRLVARFPVALRPVRPARVRSSSVSRSGDRVQVGLVASTGMSPADVLLAYRTRLARRGLVEVSQPPTLPGSSSAAFRRGGNVVTITVTADGARTVLSLHATLRPGRG
jgi:hypothetical protein